MPDRHATDRYTAMLAGHDPVARQVAVRQLRVLECSRRRPRRIESDVSDEPTDGTLLARIEAAVGPLRDRGNGDAEGPCAWHGSRGGRCLLVFAGGRRWRCRDCRRGGDVAAWVAALEGVTYGEARRLLGLPTDCRAVRRPTLSVEVVL